MSESAFEVLIDPTGDYAEAARPEDAVYATLRLLDEAREAGSPSPAASVFHDGRLVRANVRRTDLERGLGVCWCGRYALYSTAGDAFCCAQHEVLWDAWQPDLRARTIVARFIHIYGR